MIDAPEMFIFGRVLFMTLMIFAWIAAGLAMIFSNIINSDHANSFNRSEVGDPLYLTPYIESGRIDEAQFVSRVTVPEVDWVRKSHAGFITIHKTYRSHLYFWYFEAEVSSHTAPLVIWLQGGPGTTSLLGLFAENGPFAVNEFGNPIKRKYSWHANHNLLYIDNPVSTGYSSTGFILGHPTNSIGVGEDLYKFLVQFMQLFPELQRRELFITGESYAGKYVPAFAHVIHKMKLKGGANSDYFNLHGISLGNAFVSPVHQIKLGEYLYQLGFCDDKTRDEFLKHEQKGAEELANGNIIRAYLAYDPIFTGVLTGGSLLEKSTQITYLENYLLQTPPDYHLDSVINSATWRRAMHVGDKKFHFNNGFADNLPGRYMFLDILNSVGHLVEELLEHYRVIFYNGQLDLVCPYPNEVNFLRHLNFSGARDYLNSERKIWKVGDQVAGYVKEAGNLVEVMVRNAGHMVPADQPEWAFDLISRFTRNKSFT